MGKMARVVLPTPWPILRNRLIETLQLYRKVNVGGLKADVKEVCAWTRPAKPKVKAREKRILELSCGATW